MKQRRGAHAVQLGVLQCLGGGLVELSRPGVGGTAGEDVGGAGLFSEFGDNADAVAPAQGQVTADGRQRAGQGGQAVVQPPAGGAAQRPAAGRGVIKDEHGKDGLSGVDGSVQRGVV